MYLWNRFYVFFGKRQSCIKLIVYIPTRLILATRLRFRCCDLVRFAFRIDSRPDSGRARINLEYSAIRGDHNYANQVNGFLRALLSFGNRRNKSWTREISKKNFDVSSLVFDFKLLYSTNGRVCFDQQCRPINLPAFIQSGLLWNFFFKFVITAINYGL